MERQPHSEPTDADLVQALREGDSSAFEVLMGRHINRVYTIAYRYLGNGEDAADVAQEVFVKIHRSIDRFSGKSQLTTWIHRIVVNTSIGALRKRSRQVDTLAASYDQETPENAPPRPEPADTKSRNPRQCLEDKEWDALLQEKLLDLPEAYRMTFILREIRQLSYEEIADVLAVPIGTVRSRLHHARQRLKAMLGPYLEMEHRAAPRAHPSPEGAMRPVPETEG